MMRYDFISELIEDSRGEAVDFGNSVSNLIPSDARIKETESMIGQKLPESYLWFLENYGGGTIFGDEIFSIAPEYSDKQMSDVAARTLYDRRNGFIEDYEISVCFTDFGEQFLLDASDQTGEYPVVRKTGNLRKIIASDFGEFLVRFIKEEIS